MKQIKNIIFFFILAAVVTPQINAQNLSLTDAVKIALERNEKIKQYNERLIQKEYEDKSAFGNFLPKISLSYRFTHMNKNLDIDLSPIRSAMIQMQVKNQVEFSNVYNLLSTGEALTDLQRSGLYSQYSAGLENVLPQFVETLKKQDYHTATFEAVQPLFVGGKLIAAKNYSSAEKKAADHELTKIKNEVIKETIDDYLRVSLLKEVVATRENVLAGIKLHEQQAEKLLNEGVIANYQLLRAKVAVAEAERNLTTDLNNLELAKAVLKSTLALDETTEIDISDSLLFHDTSFIFDEFISKSKTNQPILKMLAEKLDAAKQKYVAARGEMLPQIAAFGKYELYPEYLSALEPRWAVGVQAKLAIFNGTKNYNELQSAEHLENEVKFIIADTERKINLWIDKSFKNVNNNKTLYKKLESDLNLVKENLRMNEKRFNSGLGTSLEVVDAELSYEKVEVERLAALYDYYTSITDLYLAAGSPAEVLEILYSEEN